MKIISFRVKIIGTIILVVSLFSIGSFALFNLFLSAKLVNHTEETYNQINLLRDQYYFTISQHKGKTIKSILENIEKNKEVLRAYLVNSKSQVIYPNNYSLLNKDTTKFAGLYKQDKDISIVNYQNASTPYYRIFIRLQNTPTCHSCHNPATQKNLGMIVMDISNNETQQIVTLTRKFSIYYTLFILITIFTLVAFLHYKYIRKSLNQFRSAIKLINEGHLENRLAIPEVREFGTLGKDFNKMVDTFENAQAQLQTYHQKELQNSQKLATIGEMSARIAHEIRNPITGIARAMEIIVSDMKESDHKPILEEIQRQANRVNQAISNMLQFSRSKDLSSEPGDINEVIKSLVFFLRNQAHDKAITFELDLPENIPQFSFDHELIENVLLNLSFNAISAIQGTGIITYKTWYHSVKKSVILSIKDNGNGVPPGKAEEIFKPFFTTSTKGTGLGLAISKDIVEKHNGRLWFHNNMDSGCTFFISLPI
jgi:signal transduction histidine kinase